MSREDKLEQSMMGLSKPGFLPYSTGRRRLLKRLGNRFFGGDGGDDWDIEEKMGTAWVVYTVPLEKAKELMAKDNPREAFAAIWEEDMHASEIERTYDFVMQEAGLTEAAETEVDESGKKPEGSRSEATTHTG